MNNDESGELFAKSLEGHADGLNRLIDHYRPYLVQMARAKLDSAISPRADASDVVQQTCLEVYRDFEAFHGTEEGQFVAWLKQILHNNVANTIREHVHTKKRSTDRERSLDDSGGTDGRLPTPAATKQSTPSAHAIRGEEFDRLTQELHHLPFDQQKAVRLRYLEGWSLRQLAEHFGRSEVAVAGLLKRGMKSLRSQIAEDEQE